MRMRSISPSCAGSLDLLFRVLRPFFLWGDFWDAAVKNEIMICFVEVAFTRSASIVEAQQIYHSTTRTTNGILIQYIN